MADVKITPHDIITMLPFDAEFKTKLLMKLETADEDTKFNIEEALWEAYDDMFEILRDGHLQNQLQTASDNDAEELNADFYKKALEKADKDMINMKFQGSTSNELTNVREKLKGLMGGE